MIIIAELIKDGLLPAVGLCDFSAVAIAILENIGLLTATGLIDLGAVSIACLRDGRGILVAEAGGNEFLLDRRRVVMALLKNCRNIRASFAGLNDGSGIGRTELRNIRLIVD
ncbi:MAG: hypothetical protein WBP94_10090 [Rhodomicrobiaceae bacterium]